MQIIIRGESYHAALEANAMGNSISEMLPMTLRMTRSGKHEYYAALPTRPKSAGVVKTSKVQRGGIYYFSQWNAFSLVFQDTNIHPYEVDVIGQADHAIADALSASGSEVEITIKE